MFRRGGFTLLEILVVLAIIAMLVVILIPVLGRARQDTQATVCASNLRQIAVGINLYAQQNGDIYPPVRYRTDPKIRWQNMLGLARVFGGPVTTNDRSALVDNPFTNQVFNCPSVGLSKYQPSDHKRNNPRNGSYGYNWATFGPFYGDRDTPGWPHKTGDIKAPARTIMVADSFGMKDPKRGDAGPHSYVLDGPRQRDDIGIHRFGSSEDGIITQVPADNRHLGKCVAAFGDAHAAVMPYRALGYNAPDPEQVDGTGTLALWTGTGNEPAAAP
jgi:prepilin-type N-terminal cleavage/methylation domain-containing protein